MRVSLLLLLTGLAAAPHAQSIGDDVRTALPAASFGTAPVRLVYDHVTGGTALIAADGEALEAWEATDGMPYAEVPTDRTVVVEVRNANALVYEYAITATVAELRETPPACGEQARPFVLAGGLLAGGSFSPGANVPIASSGSFEEFLGLDLAGIAGLRGLRGSLPTAELVQIRRDAGPVVARLEALANRLEDVHADARTSLVQAARRGDVEPIGPQLAAIQADLEAVEPGLSDPARVPLVVDGLRPSGADKLAALLNAAAAVADGEVEDPDASATADVVRLAAQAQAAAEKAAAETAALQTLALRVATAREAATQRVTLQPGDDLREVTVEVAGLAEPVGDVVPTRARIVRAFLGPRAPRGFGCSIAVTLTFSPQPTAYGVRFGDGTIFDDTPEGLRSAPAVLFELSPPAIGSVFGLVGGVGLGDAFAPDLYAGASLRLLRPVLITGGAVWRRSRTLPDGLALGDVVAADADFDAQAFLDDLPHTWAPSLFVGLSVAP